MILSRLQLACGQLGQYRLEGVAELPDYRDGAVIVEGEDAHPAGVLHHLAPDHPPVDQLGLVHPHVDNDAVIDLLTCHGFFCQFHGYALLFCAARRTGGGTGCFLWDTTGAKHRCGISQSTKILRSVQRAGNRMAASSALPCNPSFAFFSLLISVDCYRLNQVSSLLCGYYTTFLPTVPL